MDDYLDTCCMSGYYGFSGTDYCENYCFKFSPIDCLEALQGACTDSQNTVRNAVSSSSSACMDAGNPLGKISSQAPSQVEKLIS